MSLFDKLFICEELNFITENDYILVRKRVEKTTNMLNALRNYQLNK